jgi:hypothetical protein
MAKNNTTPSDEKFENSTFDLFSAIAALDQKDYGYYDRLTDEQKSKFLPYNLLYWMSAVKSSSSEMQNYYLESANHHANKHFFNELIHSHPKLQWLMLCAISPGMGKQYHEWIYHLNSKIMSYGVDVSVDQLRNYFSKRHPDVDLLEWIKNHQRKCLIARYNPTLKIDEIEILNTILTDRDMEDYGENK